MPVSSTPQGSRLNLRPTSSSIDNAGPHKLTPKEAALRGASLAFSKQQQQQHHAQRQNLTPGSYNTAAFSPPDGGALVAATSASRTRSPTGSVSSRQGKRLSKQGTGPGNGRISRQTTGNSSTVPDSDTGQATEQERERLALFLSWPGPEQPRGPYLLPPGSRAAGTAADPKSTSFIAATLAASRSVSPGSSHAGQGGGDERAAAGRPRHGEPAPIRRKAHARTDSPAVSLSTTSSDSLPDTAHLPPANSLISMFENKGNQEADPVKDNPGGPLVNRSKAWPFPDTKLDNDSENGKELGIENVKPRQKPVPKSKPKPSPKPKPKIQKTPRAETPPPPVVRRANTEIVSPKPRRPDTKPKLELEVRAPATEATDKPNNTALEERKNKPEPPKPKSLEKSAVNEPRTVSPSDSEGRVMPKPEPPTLPARSSIPPVENKPAAPKRRQTIQRFSLAPSSDGQDLSRPLSPEGNADGRPLTRDSMSSDDTFISASLAPSRAESPPIFDPASRTLTPKSLPPRSASARPVAPAVLVRPTLTGSSQLPIDSLSDAMMAGSLASARHTPVPAAGTRSPPPVPPTRRTGGARKAASLTPSPHHMKKTLRDNRPRSDDEDARRPHHKKGLINSKKHIHHEGSRRRWREEITERERKRYEAVWASNRGLFLVPAPSGGPAAARDRSHEELSEHVASVVVRDIWSRSRLPAPELAEVWDLVYGLGQEGGPLVAAALSKSEFVVGMWLIDQRLRGRKIPPRVSDSVWTSAKGLWSAAARNPNHHHHHRKKVKEKGN